MKKTIIPICIILMCSLVLGQADISYEDAIGTEQDSSFQITLKRGKEFKNKALMKQDKAPNEIKEEEEEDTTDYSEENEPITSSIVPRAYARGRSAGSGYGSGYQHPQYVSWELYQKDKIALIKQLKKVNEKLLASASIAQDQIELAQVAADALQKKYDFWLALAKIIGGAIGAICTALGLKKYQDAVSKNKEKN